ncbi:hypothetical protein HU200_044282 [Digitaria exilis]|uniref:Uncharacterized protein n=1 Tax=Digitaria exilis TaxID=1010633 RepID=A0A835B9L1_9POAL|nr:hypothetical protein HU200_044282 [Digitaria exilis]
MALPSVHVYLMAEAELLRLPRVVVLEGVEWVADAPAMLDIFEDKIDEGTGWEVPRIDQLRRASNLDARLRLVRYHILPALDANPADDGALRRLVGQAQAIRRIGTRSPEHGQLRELAIGLGNRLRKVGESKRPPSWLAERIYSLQTHCKKVHKRRYIPFL